MSFRWIAVTLLVILMLAGFISGAYSNSIQRALTLPQTQSRQNTMKPIGATVPTMTVKPTQPTAPGQPPNTTLAHDTFQRGDQTLWGTATDGRSWEGDANTATIFSITGGMGQIAGGQGTFSAVLGPNNTNTDALISATLSNFNAGKTSIGAVVRWQDTNNWYKAAIDGAHLSVIKHVKGVGTLLTSVPFTAQADISYTLRLRALGATIFAKVWPTAAPEPATWMITTSDLSLTAGQGGIRIVVQNNAIASVSAFLETAVNAAV